MILYERLFYVEFAIFKWKEIYLENQSKYQVNNFLSLDSSKQTFH